MVRIDLKYFDIPVSHPKYGERTVKLPGIPNVSLNSSIADKLLIDVSHPFCTIGIDAVKALGLQIQENIAMVRLSIPQLTLPRLLLHVDSHYGLGLGYEGFLQYVSEIHLLPNGESYLIFDERAYSN